MKSICIITQYGDVRWNNYGKCDFGDLASTNHLEYSNKYGYSYINYTVNDSDYAEWHPTWIKIDLLLKTLPLFDYVVWIDADAIFYNKNIKIEDFIEEDVDLIIPKSEPDQFNNNKMWTNTMTNFMIWKNSEWSFKILNELWNTPNNFRFDFFHEQSRLDEILNSHYQEGGGENILHNLIDDIETPIKLKNIKILPYLYNRNFDDGEIKYIYHAGGSTPTKLKRINNVINGIKNKKNKIALTVTSSKRYDLLNDTINTFFDNCTDSDELDEIIIFDDSSDDIDRFRIYSLLYKKFKKSIKFIFFDKESFNNNRRHRNIINLWKNEIKRFDYVFHLEDDWRCVNKFSIQKTIDILSENQNIAYCGFSQKKFEWIPEVYGNLTMIDDKYWVWPYKESMGDKFWFTQPGSNDKIFNWPHFSLRPGLFDIRKLNTLSEIPDCDRFERAFGMLFSEKYVSIHYIDNIFIHTGDEISSYVLNKSDR